MKNLKLFTIPLIGAAFLVACGPKSMSIADFRKKVEENYKQNVIEKHFGNTLHVTGDTDSSGEETFTVMSLFPEDQSIYPYPTFYYENTGGQGYCPYIFASDILSVKFVDFINEEAELAKKEGIDFNLNLFISDNTYTIETIYKQEGAESYIKSVYNKELIINHFEQKTTVSGKTEEKKFDYNYK